MRSRFPRLFGRALVAVATAALVFGPLPAGAAQAAVGLGTAGSYAVLGGSAVTNTGPSVINGNLGVSPGTAITGFPPGIVNGTVHSADAHALQAQSDTTTAYNDAAGRSPFTAVATELGGRTLGPGVYRNATLGLTGTLTLDARGDPHAVFIFQAGSTLITGSGSRVNVINGAQACNVFWQVGSSATLGTSTDFVGNVLALTSITANNGATVQGRLLARNGAVTLDNNRITASNCAASSPTTTAPTTTTTTTTTTTPSTTTTTTPTKVTAPPTGGSPDATGGTGGTGSPTATGTVGAGGTPGDTSGGTAVPAAGTGGSVPGGTPPGTGTDGGGSSTMTSLPRTGSGLTTTAIAGALALLLGAAIVHGTRRPELVRVSGTQRAGHLMLAGSALHFGRPSPWKWDLPDMWSAPSSTMVTRALSPASGIRPSSVSSRWPPPTSSPGRRRSPPPPGAPGRRG